ncbi:hypothetical protein [Aureivirga marina]|uniref:hypothetical protein n=1 Tax=Aureivirga marina TaxID=1182451 RepID=UPI0018CA97EE|nr:hypothetical protein [Aureivirga marina]
MKKKNITLLFGGIFLLIVFTQVSPTFLNFFKMFGNNQTKLNENKAAYELGEISESTYNTVSVALGSANINFMQYGIMIGIFILTGIAYLLAYFYTKKKKKRLQNKIQQFQFDHPPLDYHHNNLIDFTPISSGTTSNSYTAKLDFKKSNYVFVRGTYLIKFMYVAMFILGLNSLIFSYYKHYVVRGNPITIGSIFSEFFTSGGIFMIIAVAIFLFINPTGIFDLKNQRFISLNTVNLSEIQGLQIVPKLVSTRKSGMYKCYELNIVLNNGERANVMQHGDEIMMLHDAFKLKNKLNLPLWKAE